MGLLDRFRRAPTPVVIPAPDAPVDFAAALDALRAAGWRVRLRSAPAPAAGAPAAHLLPAPLRLRYPCVPIECAAFLAALDECASPDETAWFRPLAGLT